MFLSGGGFCANVFPVYIVSLYINVENVLSQAHTVAVFHEFMCA